VFSGDRRLAVSEACVEVVQLRLAFGLATTAAVAARPERREIRRPDVRVEATAARLTSSPPYTIVCGIDRTASSVASGPWRWTCSTAA
jgi:hypothetical protein